MVKLPGPDGRTAPGPDGPRHRIKTDKVHHRHCHGCPPPHTRNNCLNLTQHLILTYFETRDFEIKLSIGNTVLQMAIGWI